MKIHLLDVGRTKYGDSILIQQGDRTILIDGAHPGDANLIRTQLKKLLGRSSLRVNLLVVTHCHSDHIGCLPALIETNELTADVAVVADEAMGFGRSGVDSRSPMDAMGLTQPQRALVAALQEEDHTDLPAADLYQFLQDAARLEDQYARMLTKLDEGGTRIVRFGKDSDAAVRKVEKEFESFGLQLLGPTVKHLQLCARVLEQDMMDIGVAIAEDARLAIDAGPTDLVSTYRHWVGQLPRAAADSEFAQDRPGPGAAKNDQSIVLKVQADGWQALLAGDMQFAKAEVPGLTPIMKSLRDTVKDSGPYEFVKFTHHTSYNGVDESVMSDFELTKLFAHTGGLHDPDHPDPKVLRLIKSLRDAFTFARTDHNGLITVEKVDGTLQMSVDKGRLNDFTANPKPDESLPIKSTRASGVTPIGTTPGFLSAEGAAAADVVEVVIRVPHVDTRVAVTIDVDPGKKKVLTRATENPRGISPGGETEERVIDAGQRPVVGGGRPMPRLMFVTNAARLATNIGRAEATAVVAAIRATPGVQLVDIPVEANTAEKAANFTRSRLAEGVEGIVLVGGYDVAPANRLDVLDAALRKAVADAGYAGQDADDFIVWSDEIYGDFDGDGLPELPVSRIPDGRLADVVIGALQAPSVATDKRFGVHNRNRPFAVDVFPMVPGPALTRLEESAVYSPQDVPQGAAAGAVYFMLHGSARDGTRLWGETKDGDLVEAVAVENVPMTAPGTVVFSGCCWGALTMWPPAGRARADAPLRSRSPESSVAVAYLKAGAQAFVGCTGSHYSPLTKPFDYFGRPMHDAFWKAMRGGRAPAAALFEAKREFARLMPHGQSDPFSQAVEVKILRQFTCLGLGW